ncbi:MAG: acyl-ACP--UDP-N-acetylglucosamine O-acyltransferase [Bacteroidetes bacterium]|nr:acyl-ACP--UDP-N-acetylglucosamine O-acyltransferase [Bacteroidota bacterium]
MPEIHKTAVVDPKARIGEGVVIGPFAFIEADVEIGENSKIGPHACLYNGARIGSNVTIYQGASISHAPQDLKYAGEESHTVVGSGTTIHEFVTLHRGTVETRLTSIGENCLLMAYSHVAHDCRIGNNVILANTVQVGGHATIEDYTIIGGCTPVHQFCKIGKHCMIGGGFRVVQDVPPYILAGHEPLKYEGLNLIGLRRRGFTNDEIMRIKKIYELIYQSHLNLTQAKEQINQKFADDKFAAEILDFISRSTRGLIR